MKELLQGHYYHVSYHTRIGSPMFRHPSDYVSFIHRAAVLRKQHNLELLSYCVLPDHYHFLIGAGMQEAPGTIKGNQDMHPLTNFIYILHHHYNQNKGTSTDPFTPIDNNFNAILVDNTDHVKLATCFIHFHAERLGLIKDAKDWPYSSLKLFLDDFEGNEDDLIDRRFFHEQGEYERFFKDYCFNKKEKDSMIEYLWKE